jgi:hypothetical protein
MPHLTPDAEASPRSAYQGRISRRHASHAVVNPTDQCSLACAHCLYATPLQRQAGAPRPSELDPATAGRLGTFLADAGVRQLVISGGGEPLENLPAIVSLIGALSTVEELVIITSCHYARSGAETEAALGPVLETLARQPGSVRLIIRLSADVGHRIDPACYRRVAEWAAGRASGQVSVQAVVRSTMSDLARGAAGTWLGAFSVDAASVGPPAMLPVIDGMPVTWIRAGGAEVPVIFKPDYGLGFQQRVMQRDWRYLAQAEDRAGTPFNLSWRGARGQGHNYYGTIIRGEEHCRPLLAGGPEYITPKSDQAKGLSLYATASGRTYVNAGPPDAWLAAGDLPSWDGALARYDRDALMNLAVNNPTAVLYALAREADPAIAGRADAENFVFSPARLSMRTARLRAYLAGIQASAAMYADPGERERMWESLAGLDDREQPQGRFPDPIVGNCVSIYEQ